MGKNQDEPNKGRYARQIPVLGERGQKILSESKVLVAGAGGLGSAAATFLAHAGIGYLRIVDYDIIEKTNLNRQILYQTSDIGRKKTEAAKERIESISPEITVDAINLSIDEENCLSLFEDIDIVIDGMDNFTTRYILNRASQKSKVPFIHGAVNGFYGQATTIIPGETPCLRCIIPNPPEGRKVPVFGFTCGAIGAIEATEAVKYLTGIGILLTNRLLFWDGLRCEAEYIPVKRSPKCPDCEFLKKQEEV